jgi:hypothetical protein
MVAYGDDILGALVCIPAGIGQLKAIINNELVVQQLAALTASKRQRTFGTAALKEERTQKPVAAVETSQMRANVADFPIVIVVGQVEEFSNG